MVQKHQIKCQHCGKNTGYYHENFMFMVVTNDIKCPHCDKTIISANTRITFSYNNTEMTYSRNFEISNFNVNGVNFQSTYFKDNGNLIVDYPHKIK